MMQTIQVTDQGYWLLTQGSALYLQDGELPFGTAEQCGVVGLQGCVIGEFRQQPLWLIAEIPNDQQHSYTSLRDQLYRSEDEFNLLNRGVALNYFLQHTVFAVNVVNEITYQQMNLQWNVQNVATVTTQSFVRRLLLQ